MLLGGWRHPPSYIGDAFIEGDALEYLADRGFMSSFDAIACSPPCQRFTAYRRRGNGVGDSYPDLIHEVRRLLRRARLPWVIENVVGAPLENPVTLCGSSFGLDVRRHRCFESNIALLVPPCAHGWQTPRFAPATNRSNLRKTVEVGVWRIPLDVQQRAMGVDWMTLRELSQAVPPAFTEHIGKQLLVRAGSLRETPKTYDETFRAASALRETQP